MSTPTLPTLITDAGYLAAIDAEAGGLTLRLSHIAVGDGTVEPNPATTALASERERVPIAAAMRHDDGPALEVRAVLEAGVAPDYRLREVGVFTDTGVLFAIGFRAAGIIDRTAGARYVFAHWLSLVGVPAEIVTIDAPISLDLAFTTPLLSLVASDVYLHRVRVEEQVLLRRALGRIDGRLVGAVRAPLPEETP